LVVFGALCNEQKVRNYYFRELYTFIFMSFNKFMALVEIYRIQSKACGPIGLLPRGVWALPPYIGWTCEFGGVLPRCRSKQGATPLINAGVFGLAQSLSF
jgi:hypothetical protein